MNDHAQSALETMLVDLRRQLHAAAKRQLQRRRRRRVYGITTLTALIVVSVASAYALGHPIIDFGNAAIGPKTVIDDFSSLDVAAPSGMAPGVIADQVRSIPGLYVGGKPYTLWVAPTKQGGYCDTSGCIANRSSLAGHIDITESGNKTLTGVSQINDPFIESGGDRLVLSYEDGTSDDVPFVWVTEPINAGFFVFDIPEAHQVFASDPSASRSTTRAEKRSSPKTSRTCHT